jgi:hypothetical protein
MKETDDKYYLSGITAEGEVAEICELPELMENTEGNEEYSWVYEMHADSENNLYILHRHWVYPAYIFTLFKYSNDGTLIVSKVMPENETYMAMGSDGYLYTLTAYGDHVNRRSLSTLEVIASIEITHGEEHFWLCFDSENYLYTYCKDTKSYIKFLMEDGTGTIIDSHVKQYEVLANRGEWEILGDYLVSTHRILFYSELFGIMPISLTEDMSDFPTVGIPTGHQVGLAQDSEFWYLAGLNVAEDGIIMEKYDSDRTWVSTVVLTTDWNDDNRNSTTTLSDGVFVIEKAYDYPLSPIMFPAKNRSTTLKQDCINFEESMSDICLVFNNNVKVTRLYLQEVYGDTTYPENSNLREVLPSQQLVKLHGEDLDFKAIINNFISNVSDMFILINENNALIKQWLDDYEPDELGHDFTDVKMRPIIIGEDLSKTMNALFEGIIDNVTILNMNLDLLKERF